MAQLSVAGKNITGRDESLCPLQLCHHGNDHGAALGLLVQVAADGGLHGAAHLAVVLAAAGRHAVHGFHGHLPHLLQQLFALLYIDKAPGDDFGIAQKLVIVAGHGQNTIETQTV